MLLENLSTNEVEDYLNDKDIILIPIGAVEQHSQYGLIGTDFIVAENIAREIGKRMDILVAPTINYGISPHHMAFMGTATVTPNTFILVKVHNPAFLMPAQGACGAYLRTVRIPALHTDSWREIDLFWKEVYLYP